MKTVLVTGGSGFIGSWVIINLLRRGYIVRATLRNLAREQEVRSAISKQVQANERLSFFAANLLKDEGWEEATDGAQSVVHVASPMPVGEYRKTDVIRPAREGTQRVLKTAARAGVHRVVITSSVVACAPAENYQGGPVDEMIWTDLSSKLVDDYTRAKTLAEQDAWEFKKHQSGPMTLTTILPGMVQGPILGPDYSGSVELITRLMTGKVPRFPNTGFSIVDVRDLSELHVMALESEKAVGQRFIGAGDFLWLADIARLLRANFGKKAAKVPTKALSDSVVRLLAYVSFDLRFLAPTLGKRREYSNEKAADVLGWHPRPATETIIETAESLLREGLV